MHPSNKWPCDFFCLFPYLKVGHKSQTDSLLLFLIPEKCLTQYPCRNVNISYTENHAVSGGLHGGVAS